MLRMPNGLRDHLRKQAAQNRRSMNAEVVVQLERAYGLTEAAGQVSQANDLAASSNTDACQGADIINRG